MIDPVTGMAIAQGASALLGAFGANEAANAQERAARQQQEIARRNMLMGLGISEPLRSTGYQALDEINRMFGYTSAPYSTGAELARTATPITYKNVAKYIKQGASLDDIAQMGTLGAPGTKGLKRLMRAGLTMADIQRLQAGVKSSAATPATPSETAAPTGLAAFQASPDYQFRRDEGTRAIGNSFAARGGAASGNALRALSEFNSNLAAGEFDNWFNRRMRLATGGGDTAGQQAATTYSNQAGAAAQNVGDARASGVLGVTNALGQGVQGIGDMYIWNRYLQSRPTGQTSPYSPYGPYSGGYRLPGG